MSFAFSQTEIRREKFRPSRLVINVEMLLDMPKWMANVKKTAAYFILPTANGQRLWYDVKMPHGPVYMPLIQQHCLLSATLKAMLSKNRTAAKQTTLHFPSREVTSLKSNWMDGWAPFRSVVALPTTADFNARINKIPMWLLHSYK